MTKSGTKVGFIGLGIMGTPMALHLANAGHQLFVHTRSKLHPEIADSSATVSSSPPKYISMSASSVSATVSSNVVRYSLALSTRSACAAMWHWWCPVPLPRYWRAPVPI